MSVDTGNRNVGIVKFYCHSNTRNNSTDTSSEAYRFLKDAIVNAVAIYLRETQEHSLHVQFACGCSLRSQANDYEREERSQKEMSEERENQYLATNPDFSFSRLVLNDKTKGELERGVRLFEFHDLIFNKWGLKANSPHPVVALNFFGPPGTGKTLAAHAMADYLKKKIIIASYAQIESMYHGEGPKNVEAIFKAAEKQDAILFIDEADSLLSSRLTNVRQGSENAINSMRSQILICLERFSGIVIFATNLVSNYDRAFESRVRSIEFALPDEACRQRLWLMHLPPTFPVSKNVSVEELARIDDVCGREIRNAVQNVAEKMAVEGLPEATLEMFKDAVENIKSTRFKKNPNVETVSLSGNEKKILTETCDKVIKQRGIV